MTNPTPRGLTAAEVGDRLARGQVNRTPSSAWADYAQIVRSNLFTLFNALVVPAALALFYLGKVQGGIAVSGMATINSLLGLVQEIKAKRHLDQLAILIETRARVLRDGQPHVIPASAVVLDDHLLLSSGEAVVADGEVLQARYLEVDEALLTGEADPVRRQVGETVLSGSFCVAGEGVYRADKVGSAAFAQSTSAQARRYHFAISPMTATINLLIQILTWTAAGLCLLYFVLHLLGRIDNGVMVVMMAATITSMVPQGLVLTATISFALGAVQMSKRGAIVQRLNAVESMAAVDVVCTDKTGTLTTNRLRLDHLRPLATELAEEEIRRRLRLFASASVDRQNKNVQALRTALGTVSVELLDQLAFKSQNRYSAVCIRDTDRERILVLGACESLRDHLVEANDWEAGWRKLLPSGLRLLLFAEATGLRPFADTLTGMPLRPLALIALSDELRPEVGQVLQALNAQGIAFKILSGDNPETVRATVGKLELPMARDPVVSGEDLANSPEKVALIQNRSVFGRVSPRQKVEIVETLQRQGHFVAMIGDGVNDVLSLKKAHLGIAMGEGSQAAKTVAGLILENNQFALLPETLEEGRTIIRNLRRSGKLFLTKNVYSLLLLLPGGLHLFGLPFPYVPQQVTLLNWLVIGIPALVIALSRERSRGATRPNFLREVGGFAIRSGVVFAVAGLTLLLLAKHVWHSEECTQRTQLLSLLILLGITALLRALVDGETQPLAGDTRFRLLAAAALPLYLLAMYWDLSAGFFELAALDWVQWGQVLAVALPAWGLSLLSDHLGKP